MQTQGEAGADRIVRERFFADATHGVFDSHGEAYETGAVSYESFSSLAVKPAYRELRADADVKTIKVDVRRLDTILAEHAPGVERVDIVSVDVEGWELEVLAGLSFDRYRPRVLIVENLFGDEAYRDALAARDYLLWRRLGPNDIYAPAFELSRGERLRAELRRRVSRLRPKRG